MIPKISVIVATYNQEKYIGRCLRSLLNQTLDNNDYEIIVINDGSTDRTKFALTLFDDAITLIENQVNLGLPASLNLGIKKSRGSYIVRVDSDDYVNSNFLNFLSYYLDENKFVNAIGCDYFLVGDDESVISRENCLENPIACGIMFRKKELMSIGLYDENFNCHEDRELRIRFEKNNKIYRLDLPLYRYRRHQNNLTNNKSEMDYYSQKLDQKHK